MEATKEVTLSAEFVERDVNEDTSALRELAALELGLVGGGSAAVVFL